jgi:hypothetical protein
MGVVTSQVRPAAEMIYQVAGRTLSVNTPDSPIAKATDRFLSALRLDRITEDHSDSQTVKLRISAAKSELPNTISPGVVSDEASYYYTDESYLVRIGDSLVSADASCVVNVNLAEDLDCNSFLFQRVLIYGLAAALRRAGAFELQCAAVIDPQTEISALIVGPSGSGKSTLALQLAATGWNFSTDDVVLLTAQNDLVEACGLRRHFALTSETIVKSSLAQLDSVLSYTPGADSKFYVCPQDFFPSRYVSKCVPEILIFSSRTGDPDSRIKSISQAEVMNRLLKMCPWALIDMPTAREFLDVLGKLAKQSRAIDLFAGTDLLGNSQYTAEFLASIVRQEVA